MGLEKYYSEQCSCLVYAKKETKNMAYNDNLKTEEKIIVKRVVNGHPLHF